MNKRILFAFSLVLIVAFSISTIQANDLNMTDSNSTGSDVDVSLQIEDEGQLESPDSNNLSKDMDNLNQTELTSPSNSIYYKGSYSVTLIDLNTNTSLANKTVNFVINKVSFNATTDSEGVASVDLNFNPGKYDVYACFEGDEYYQSSNLTSKVEILPTIKANDVSKYYKGSEQYIAQFFDSKGNALSNAQVKITVNGKSYTKKTDKNGFVKISVNLKPGTYKIVSTDPITGYKITNTFKILSTIKASDIKLVEGEGKKFSATFYKSNGKPLANQYVKFKVKGKVYKVKTNSKGKALFALNKFKRGTYKIICYNKDGLTKTSTIKVYKRKASTKLSTSSYTYFLNETKTLKIKFTTSLGDSSCSGKVIKIKVNGKTYSKKTNSEGMINFNLPLQKKGLYTVEYNYQGNKFFKASKSKNLLTIIPSSNTALKVKSTKHFGYGAGTLFKLSYTAGGVPLAKKTVTLTINGKEYTRTTDNNGIASIPINLEIGNYTVSYKTAKQSKLNAASGSCEIDVFMRSPSKIVWKCGSSYNDNAQVFKVFVTDSKGNHVSGGTITLTIDSEDYTANVASNGYATVKTSVALGKYKVSVKYNGNNNFLPSSSSKTVNVKLSKFGNGLNEKNAVANLKAYLKSSRHCQVGNSKIKAVVKSLTKGLTNDIDKAKAIFNFVRDNLVYSYYYDTKYGAATTLKLKKGNCVDHSHLLVAMFRTAGFKARYVHGICHFIRSGDTCGHVWTQVKIGKTWVVGDAISYSNSLGKINNWNTKSYSIRGKYVSLPF